MVARSVRCRAGAVRSPVVRSRNRSASRAPICSTDSARTRAAASSMARGIPSSARHSVATAPALSSLTANPGSEAAARSANKLIASDRYAASTVAIMSSATKVNGGTDSGGTCHTCSAATRSGSRLVTISRSPGALASSRWQTWAQTSIRCSQLSSAISSCRERSASASVSSSGRGGSSLMPRTEAIRNTTRSGWVRSDRSTTQAPSGNSSAA